MKMKLRISLTSFLLLILGEVAAFAQNDIKNEEFNPVNTGVTTLSITPDARGSGMGNLGAATDPDVNSQFWNPSKYAFAYSKGGVAIS
ncbi:MAG: hypothetical protein K2G69_09600, partial [Muribaculaceae bacterium]|nr:hypothetical protein [Muribaculaceae bacterium]